MKLSELPDWFIDAPMSFDWLYRFKGNPMNLYDSQRIHLDYVLDHTFTKRYIMLYTICEKMLIRGFDTLEEYFLYLKTNVSSLFKDDFDRLWIYDTKDKIYVEMNEPIGNEFLREKSKCLTK